MWFDRQKALGHFRTLPWGWKFGSEGKTMGQSIETHDDWTHPTMSFSSPTLMRGARWQVYGCDRSALIEIGDDTQ
jgi:hypothetical protein